MKIGKKQLIITGRSSTGKIYMHKGKVGKDEHMGRKEQLPAKFREFPNDPKQSNIPQSVHRGPLELPEAIPKVYIAIYCP